jgi:hypothetical protein
VGSGLSCVYICYQNLKACQVILKFKVRNILCSNKPLHESRCLIKKWRHSVYLVPMSVFLFWQLMTQFISLWRSDHWRSHSCGARKVVLLMDLEEIRNSLKALFCETEKYNMASTRNLWSLKIPFDVDNQSASSLKEIQKCAKFSVLRLFKSGITSLSSVTGN